MRGATDGVVTPHQALRAAADGDTHARLCGARCTQATAYQHWAKNTHWLEPGRSVCDDWHGVACNGDGRVVALDLKENNLDGACCAARWRAKGSVPCAFACEGLARSARLRANA